MILFSALSVKPREDTTMLELVCDVRFAARKMIRGEFKSVSSKLSIILSTHAEADHHMKLMLHYEIMALE